MNLPDCELPGIPIKPENLEIIDTPTRFYDTLINLSKSAENRITLSSLYLGEGQLEKKLVDTIRERLEERNLKVTVLLDMLRGTRKSKTGESSVSVLKPISNKAKIFLYHTPELHGLLKRVLPERADEIVGLQHMKLYIFDDNVLISGANLSDSYFTDRMDRYFLFKNCAPLANFFDELVNTVGATSFVVAENEVIPSAECCVHPFRGGSEDYRALLKSRVEDVIEKYRKSRESEQANSDTWIFPVLQMGLLGINQEFDLLSKIFSLKNDELQLTVASGYFNFIEDYEDLIFNEGTYQMDVLTASPLANGFFGSRGFSKYIPPLYSNISGSFLDKKTRTNRDSVRMFEYFREGWTFHAKGLWAEQASRVSTLVGSSNYGYRSVHRDLEAQVMVVTSEPELLSRLIQEKRRLFEYSTVLDAATLQKPEHYVPAIVRLISKFARSFL